MSVENSENRVVPLVLLTGSDVRRTPFVLEQFKYFLPSYVRPTMLDSFNHNELLPQEISLFDKSMTVREISVTYKHYIALKYISAQDCEFGIVCEDNIQLSSQMSARVESYFSESTWDMIFESDIVSSLEFENQVRMDRWLYECPRDGFKGTHGASRGANFVVVKKDIARLLVENFFPCRLVSDHHYNFLIKNLGFCSCWTYPTVVHKLRYWGSTVSDNLITKKDNEEESECTEERKKVSDDLTFHRILKSKGYHNFNSYLESGEEFFFKEILPRICPEVSIDIGAHVGDTSAFILENTESSVYALEPLSGSSELLRKRLEPYKGRASVHNLAISDVTEVVKIFSRGVGDSGATICEHNEAVSDIVTSGVVEKVWSVTLDAFVDRYSLTKLDFIKIDVEGAELRVLRGASDVINKLRPKAFLIENNRHALFSGASVYALSNFLKGYRIFQLLANNQGMREVSPTDPYANIFHYSNFLYVNEDCFKAIADLKIV